MEKKVTPPLEQPPVPQVNVESGTFPSIRSQYEKGRSVYDVLKEYGEPYDYEKEMRDAEINRKGALFSDIATSISNMATGMAGRRAYNVTPPATALQNQNVERLRQLRANQNVQYKRDRLNAMMQQLQFDRQDRNRYEDIARDDARYKDQIEYRNRQENVGNEERAYRKDMNERDFKFRETEAQRAQRNADRNYYLSAENAKENRALREMQIASNAGGTTGKKSYIIGAGGRRYEYPKEMTDAVTARLFDVMRDEASKEGITIDNTELLMGGNETKSSAMKAFVENNLSKYPGAEAELRRMFGEDVETPEVPAWITNNQPAPKKWVPGSAQQSTSKPIKKWTPKK